MPIQRRFRTILTARLILEYREHTLYLSQAKSNGESFTLPGGKIEGEEYAKEALIREAFEEAGIVLNKKSLNLVHVVYKRLHSTTEIIFFFHAAQWKGELKINEPDKFKDTVWLPNDEPPKRMPAVIQSAMSKIAKGKIFSQFPSDKSKEKPKEKTKEKIKEKVKEKVKVKKKVKVSVPVKLEKIKTKNKDKPKEKAKKNKIEKVIEDVNFTI